jgi:hypothetical protein
MAAALDVDDPARGFFQMWKCALTVAVSPEAGIAAIDKALPRLRANARPPHDTTLSDILGAKATGLAIARRLDEARIIAEETLAWAPAGKNLHDQALALLLWILYLTGGTPDADLQCEVGGQRQELGLAELCAAPGALCTEGSIDERAAALVAKARRRPSADVPSPYLLAFAWLAVEDGDHARAAELVATAELYDASTHIGLTFLLAKLESWTEENWDRRRDRAIGVYLSDDHDRMAKQGSAALADEVERWERRLQRTAG